MTPADRMIWMTLQIIRKNDAGLSNLNATLTSQVMTTTFEHLATTPMDELNRVAAWLGTDIPDTMPIVMMKERVPRELHTADRIKKAATLRELATPALFDELMAASAAYEKQWA